MVDQELILDLFFDDRPTCEISMRKQRALVYWS